MIDCAALSTKSAATLLSLSVRTLERYRQLHKGPVFIRMGRRVGYKAQDLAQWLDDNRTL